jgi:hypothetical protein
VKENVAVGQFGIDGSSVSALTDDPPAEQNRTTVEKGGGGRSLQVRGVRSARPIDGT